MNIYYGDEKVDNEVLQKLIGKVLLKLKESSLNYGDLIICKSTTQIGTIIQWEACQRFGLIPILVASDYPLENSRLMKLCDVNYMLRTENYKEYELINLNNKLLGKHLDIECGSVIQMTSASTGDPKFILRSKKTLDNEVERYCKMLKLSHKNVFLSIAPFYHAFGFICVMLTAMKVSATIVEPEIVLPRRVIELCFNKQVDCLYGVPYFFKKMIEVDEKYKLYDNTKYVVSSGGKMDSNLQSDFKKRFNLPIVQQYGSTETGSIAISQPNDPYNCVGQPMNKVKFKLVLDEAQRQLIYVLTEETIGQYITDEGIIPIADGFYKMNDIGSIDEKGRLFVNGREDDIIIRAGEKIDKNYVKNIIKQFEGITDVEIELDNSLTKEFICIYYGEKLINTKELREYLEKFLSKYQIPKYFKKGENKIKYKSSWKN